MKHLVVTGGAGFIGSNFVRYMLGKYPDYTITVLDKLTYAGNMENLREVENDPRYRFVRGDIADAAAVEQATSAQGCDAIINFAAETHVDRSILEPDAFIKTNVYGTYVLLEAARRLNIERYVQISTDEVYGSIPAPRSSVESDVLEPSSPYSAAKTGGELMALSYYVTYKVPVMVTRGSNNYGPFQYPEKLIPLFVTNAIESKPLPVYGDGKQVRNWIYVLDHCTGIDTVLHKGQAGEIYNVGGPSEEYNLDITHTILRLLDQPQSLISYVKDRPGHDRRYSLNADKLKALGWQPQYDLGAGMKATVDWYVANEAWWKPLKSGEYLEYYKRQYGTVAVS